MKLSELRDVITATKWRLSIHDITNPNNPNKWYEYKFDYIDREHEEMLREAILGANKFANAEVQFVDTFIDGTLSVSALWEGGEN